MKKFLVALLLFCCVSPAFGETAVMSNGKKYAFCDFSYASKPIYGEDGLNFKKKHHEGQGLLAPARIIMYGMPTKAEIEKSKEDSIKEDQELYQQALEYWNNIPFKVESFKSSLPDKFWSYNDDCLQKSVCISNIIPDSKGAKLRKTIGTFFDGLGSGSSISMPSFQMPSHAVSDGAGGYYIYNY